MGSRSQETRRILTTTVVMLLGTSFFLYALTHIIPGDPIRALFGFRPPPPELLAEIRDHYGLDDPFYVQYLKFIRNAASGDFGYSTRGPAVRDLVLSALPVSLRLMAAALTIQAVFGVAIGVLAATRGKSALGWLIRGVTLVLITIPILVVGYLLQTYIGVKTGWLPPRGVANGWRSYVLPAIALAAGATAYTIRITHTELASALSAPYVSAATAKGVSHRRVVGVHALKASIVPVVMLFAASAAQIISGLIIIEGIFRLPGVGSVVIDAIRWKDHNVIVAVLALAVVFSVFANTAADLLQTRLDPRVGVGKKRTPF